MKTKVYLAGPMRGIPFYNFPAFDKARDNLVASGFEVLSPADLDREAGHDFPVPATEGMAEAEPADWDRIPEGFDFDACVTRDIDAVRACDAIYMLRGWENSKGARAEKALAEWMGKQVLYPDFEAFDAGMRFLPPVVLTHQGYRNVDGTPVSAERLAALKEMDDNFLLPDEEAPIFPDNDAGRREYPLCTGLLEYFPRACAEVAHHSFVGNEQHNAGEPMHWAKEKSIGRGDQIVRHLMDGKTAKDRDEAMHHFAGMCWRSLELFERFLQGIEPFGKES